MRRLACLLWLIGLAMPANALAAAWTLPEDTWNLFPSLGYYTTNHYRDAAGQRQVQPRYSKVETGLYGEFGLADDLTLGTNLTLAGIDGFSSEPGSRARNLALADSAIFLRQRLWQDESRVLSFQPLLKLPSLYAADRTPKAGSDSTDLEARLLFGQGFALFGQSHFVNLEAAYRQRFDTPGNQYLADATLGLRLSERWLLLPQVFSTFSTKPAGGGFTMSGQDDYDLVKGQFSVVYRLTDHLSLQAGTFRPLYARNAGEGQGGLLSLWIQ